MERNECTKQNRCPDEETQEFKNGASKQQQQHVIQKDSVDKLDEEKDKVGGIDCETTQKEK